MQFNPERADEFDRQDEQPPEPEAPQQAASDSDSEAPPQPANGGNPEPSQEELDRMLDEEDSASQNNSDPGGSDNSELAQDEAADTDDEDEIDDTELENDPDSEPRPIHQKGGAQLALVSGTVGVVVVAAGLVLSNTLFSGPTVADRGPSTKDENQNGQDAAQGKMSKRERIAQLKTANALGGQAQDLKNLDKKLEKEQSGKKQPKKADKAPDPKPSSQSDPDPQPRKVVRASSPQPSPQPASQPSPSPSPAPQPSPEPQGSSQPDPAPQPSAPAGSSEPEKDPMEAWKQAAQLGSYGESSAEAMETAASGSGAQVASASTGSTASAQPASTGSSGGWNIQGNATGSSSGGSSQLASASTGNSGGIGNYQPPNQSGATAQRRRQPQTRPAVRRQQRQPQARPAGAFEGRQAAGDSMGGERVMVGATTRGELQIPLAWGKGGSPRKTVVRLDEPLEASNGEEALPAGALVVAQPQQAGNGGLVQLEASKAIIERNGRQIQKSLPSGAIRSLPKEANHCEPSLEIAARWATTLPACCWAVLARPPRP